MKHGALLKADRRVGENFSPYTPEAKTMEWAPVISSLSFFVFRLFAGKWNGKSAARGMDLMDKKGTTMPNRLSRLQDRFKIDTQ